MERFSPERQPEVFFSTSETSSRVGYHARKGRLRKLGPRLYTNNLTDPEEVIARRNAWRIAAGYFPGAVVVDRTAMEFQPAADGSVFMAAKTTRPVRLPGLLLRPRHGAGSLTGDRQWMGEDLYMSSRERAFVENMRMSRGRGGAVARTLGKREVEEALDAYAHSDPSRLNALRDAARRIAPDLGAEREYEELSRLIGAVLGTHEGRLRARGARARQRGLPYDERRLELFEVLQRELLRRAPPVLAEDEGVDLRTFAFFEAYFSNYIEGTEFAVNEAEEIVFEGHMPAQRPADAHDILGTYRLVADPTERSRVPRGASGLIELLRARHESMLRARPDVGPGDFKREPNRAGQTLFVEPTLVEGTLREGYRFYSSLPEGFPRAVFVHFLVSEVHPFADGNGRIARIAMNGELSAAGEQRIIVSIAQREEYLSALKAMTHNSRAGTLVRVLERLQADTATVDFSSLEAAEKALVASGAFAEPGEAELGLPEAMDALGESG